ncbi:hypothetical protein B7463_g1590, partial [Scytalidium lignicola]
MIQGLVFAGAQGMGLKSLNEHGCALVSQFMWPALFIVPYIQLVFGLECTVRSMRALPFPPRRKYDVWICLGLVILMLLGTWVPSHIHPEHDVCFASLLWFISRFGVDGLILLSICAGLIFISAITIFFRLSRANSVDRDQRIAASRMVYSLVLAFVSLAFVIPFFASLAIGKGNIKASMMATVVVNLSGLMSALLHLFLRSNATITSFGPKTERSRWNQKKRQFTMWGPNQLNLNKNVFGQSTPNLMESRADSRSSLVDKEKGQSVGLDSLGTSEIGPSARFNPPTPTTTIETSNIPTVPAPVADPVSMSPQRTPSRKQSYSLFPTAVTVAALGQPELNATPDTNPSLVDEVLEPPPRIFAGREGGLRVPNHRRDSSIASSATVQIGLRLSHARTPSQAELMSQSLSAATYKPPQSITSLQKEIINPPPPRNPLRPSPLRINLSAGTNTFKAGVNKTLPPTPRPVSPVALADTRLSNMKLSPAVYKPESPKKSPRPRANTIDTPSKKTTETSSTAEPKQSQQDWI